MKKPPQLSLSIRRYPLSGNICQVWLVIQDGAARNGFLYGVIDESKADWLQQALRIKTEKTDSPFPYTPSGCATCSARNADDSMLEDILKGCC